MTATSEINQIARAAASSPSFSSALLSQNQPTPRELREQWSQFLHRIGRRSIAARRTRWGVHNESRHANARAYPKFREVFEQRFSPFSDPALVRLLHALPP
ncbi:hypothetical protein, partial [Pseudomonas sp. 86_A]|uniref:hypothetical protein n=1 Tax=Pseudomonas sp. 86_A TaxID=2813569 RepID=UPI001A9D1B1E